MQSLFKALVLLLLAAVIAAPLAAQGLTPEFSSDQRPAGCHQHTAPVPQPGPTSHSCCQGGHYPAIVQQGPTAPSLRDSVQFVFMPDSLASRKLASSPNLMIVCSDPPIISPLRV
jgi:hypothetical protein